MGEETLKPELVRPEFKQTMELVSRVNSGDFEQTLPDEESLDPREVFSGVLFDLNDQTLTDEERGFIPKSIEGLLGKKLADAEVAIRYKSPDGNTHVTVYEKMFGTEEDPWKLSQWQNVGEEPSFIFWPEETYEWQVAEGYEEVPTEE